MKTIFYLFKIFSIVSFILINYNVNSQVYTYQKHIPYPFSLSSRCIPLVGDIDNDNDMDVILIGEIFDSSTGVYDTVSHLYINNGNLNFQNTSVFQGYVFSKGDLGDVDGDGDLDLIVFGTNQQGGIGQTYLFKYNGTNYVLYPTNIINLLYEELKFIDVDNDGDNDLIVSGMDVNQSPVTKLYNNDGTGNFTEITNTNIINLFSSTISVADVDNDGDMDFFIRGVSNILPNNTSDIFSYIYINDGSGNFAGTLLSSENQSANNIFLKIKSDFIDGDMDGDMDIIVSGYNNLLNYYENDGNNNFSINNSGLNGILNLNLPTGHYVYAYITYPEYFNSDLNKDLIVCYQIQNPSTSNSYVIIKQFLNDGTGQFNFEQDLQQIYYKLSPQYFDENLIFLDADNDNDIDILNLTAPISTNFSSQLLLYDVCNTTYSSINETACFEYTTPSGKVLTSTGIYTDTILNYKNCDSVITINLIVKEFDLTVSVLNDNSLKANQDNAIYNWGRCDMGYFNPLINETNQILYNTNNGLSYQVEITYDGCTGYSNCMPYFLNIKKTFKESSVAIYPNPNNGIFIIDFEKPSNYQVEIYDFSGKIINSFVTSQPSYEYNMNHLNNGIYFLKITNKNNQFQFYKIIKSK